MVAMQARGRAFAGSMLLLANGGIHVIAFPDHYKAAAYIGVLFLLLAAATAALAIAIGARLRFAWSVAALMSAIAIVLYALARTTGLPYYHEDSWLDMMGAFPVGLLSVIAEGAFVVMYLIWRPDAERFQYRRPAFF
jgi:hypothetical protein